MITTDVLELAFKKFGPNGEHWIKNYYGTNAEGRPESPYVNYCSFGAFDATIDELCVHDFSITEDVNKFLDLGVYEYTGENDYIIGYNDNEHTTWDDIKAVWQIAIRLSKANMVQQQ